MKLPAQEKSLLKPGGFKTTYSRITKDIKADTVIVGGGIAGISTAYLLAKAGQKVSVLEKDAIGSGTTGHTTGKVTSQHNLTYAELIKRHGRQKARLYAQSNQMAVEEIRQLIRDENIDCGWEDADNYVYTTRSERTSEFKAEAKAAKDLGLPASFEKTSPLPFPIAAAVKFSGQGHFSAQKYIEALAKKIRKMGGQIYEDSKVTNFQDGAVSTNNHQVVAENVVVATNVPSWPLIARAAYCLLEYPTTSYIVAGKPKIKLSGMYISPDDGWYSILPVGDTLLVGGENHIPGLGRAKTRQRKLAGFAKTHFGVENIDYRWHARDYLAYDNVPLVGKLYPWSKHMFVISAFKKWGLSHSMVAAQIISDEILGQNNKFASLYNPHRLSAISSIPRVVVDSFS